MTKRFNILALDGGGLKGIFSAALLAHLEADCGTKIIDHFDLITGTSTGGIVALGLAMGISPREIVGFYVSNGPKIFANKSLLKQLIRTKYEPAGLELALKECFGEKKLADSLKRIVIPSYNIGEDDVYLFKTPHHPRLRRDYKVPVWKVAMATSAAPTFFPTFNRVDHVRLVDGGVWANNPIMVGIAEAVSMLDIPMDEIYVMSIGTTSAVKKHSNKLDHGGILQWLIKGDIIDVLMTSQSRGALTQAQHLLGKDHIFRLDPKVPDGLFALDKLSEKELLAKAAHESRHFTPEFQENFLEHKAEAFIPCYKMEGEN
jgi:patatin-like phospholipase/acyl hydrolase